ncbi:MAG: SDR family NAD(P)-dependent oxidoreductase [Pseudomonadota bacterium]
MPLLTDKIALVTGASRGFGFAAARALAVEGAHVVAVARTLGGLEELDDRIGEAGGKAVLVPLDITDDPGIQRMAAAVSERFGRVDLWLHTAAFAPQNEPAYLADRKEVEKTWAVNVTAFHRLVRMVDPLLRAGPMGTALIVSEDVVGEPFRSTYASAKAAQAAITRAWAEEVRRTMTVALVAPPPMPTALRAKAYPGEDRTKLMTIDEAASRLISALRAGIAPGQTIAL